MPRDVPDQPDNVPDEVLRVLTIARHRVATAWAGNQPGDSRTTWCAMQAIVTDAYDNSYQEAANLLLKVLEPLAPGLSVAGFNDDSRTTQADIVALFDRAIAATSVRSVRVA